MQITSTTTPNESTSSGGLFSGAKAKLGSIGSSIFRASKVDFLPPPPPPPFKKTPTADVEEPSEQEEVSEASVAAGGGSCSMCGIMTLFGTLFHIWLGPLVCIGQTVIVFWVFVAVTKTKNDLDDLIGTAGYEDKEMGMYVHNDIGGPLLTIWTVDEVKERCPENLNGSADETSFCKAFREDFEAIDASTTKTLNWLSMKYLVPSDKEPQSFGGRQVGAYVFLFFCCLMLMLFRMSHGKMAEQTVMFKRGSNEGELSMMPCCLRSAFWAHTGFLICGAKTCLGLCELLAIWQLLAVYLVGLISLEDGEVIPVVMFLPIWGLLFGFIAVCVVGVFVGVQEKAMADAKHLSKDVTGEACCGANCTMVLLWMFWIPTMAYSYRYYPEYLFDVFDNKYSLQPFIDTEVISQDMIDNYDTMKMLSTVSIVLLIGAPAAECILGVMCPMF